jgi:multiple sugar transport system permease protein
MRQRWLWNLSWYVLLLLLSIPFVFPFWWMITSSLKTAAEVFAFPPTLLPPSWQWSNFVDVFTFQPFARQYFNSLYIAVAVTVLTILLSAMAGYAFARIRFPARNVIFLLLLSALMMPSEVTIIPNFFLFSFLGWLDSHVPLILLPVFGANGVVGTFLMRQFFVQLPSALEDAAMIDGLGRHGIFWRIALPLARPMMAALAILSFLYSWNLFLEPLVFINTQELFTLPLALSSFTDNYGLPIWHLQLAATTLAVVPVLVIYVLAQRHVVQSFTMSGVKG